MRGSMMSLSIRYVGDTIAETHPGFCNATRTIFLEPVWLLPDPYPPINATDRELSR